METLSSNARLYLRYFATVPGTALIIFPGACLLTGERISLIAMGLTMLLSMKHAEKIQKKHSGEFSQNSDLLRISAFNIMKWQIWLMLFVYGLVFLFSRNVVTWFYSGCLLILALVFFIHEKLEVDELKNEGADSDQHSQRTSD